jgi:hypothetical protein
MQRGSASGGAPKVLYIGGYGRSGSTVLDRILGASPAAVSVGEIRSIWGGVLREDRLCSCGRRFSACPFWTEVGSRAFGGWTSDRVRAVVSAHATIDRHRHLPRLLTGTGSVAFRRNLAVFTDALDAMYRAIAEVGDADVVVDASKYPVYAAILRTMPSLDLHVVHLIRDARGAAYSWSKEGVVKPDAADVAGGDTMMPTYGSARASGEWVFYNLSFDILRAMRVPELRVYYESLVRMPRDVVARIARFAGLPDDDASLAHIDGSEVTIEGPEHALGGNPARFGDGSTLMLRADQAWKERMPPAQRRAVTVMTSPLLARYGYLGDGR